MWIREDLKDVIKQIFLIGDLELVTLKLERGAQDLDDYFYLKKLQETTKKGYQKKTHLRKNFKKMSLIKKIKF